MIRLAWFGWIPMPVTQGCTPPFQQTRGANRSLACHSSFSQGDEEEQNLLLLRFSICQLAHFFSEEEQGVEFLQGTFFASSDCSLITGQGSVCFSQYLPRNDSWAEGKAKASWSPLWNFTTLKCKIIHRNTISCNSGKDLRSLASLK